MEIHLLSTILHSLKIKINDKCLRWQRTTKRHISHYAPILCSKYKRSKKSNLYLCPLIFRVIHHRPVFFSYNFSPRQPQNPAPWPITFVHRATRKRIHPGHLKQLPIKYNVKRWVLEGDYYYCYHLHWPIRSGKVPRGTSEVRTSTRTRTCRSLVYAPPWNNLKMSVVKYGDLTIRWNLFDA